MFSQGQVPNGQAEGIGIDVDGLPSTAIVNVNKTTSHGHRVMLMLMVGDVIARNGKGQVGVSFRSLSPLKSLLLLSYPSVLQVVPLSTSPF